MAVLVCFKQFPGLTFDEMLITERDLKEYSIYFTGVTSCWK